MRLLRPTKSLEGDVVKIENVVTVTNSGAEIVYFGEPGNDRVVKIAVFPGETTKVPSHWVAWTPDDKSSVNVLETK